MSQSKRAGLMASCAMASLFLSQAAFADNPAFTFHVCNTADLYCPSQGHSYVGIAFDSALFNTSSVGGAIQDATNTNTSDAFDGWGALYGTYDTTKYDGAEYATAFNGLDATRQTEDYTVATALPTNAVRWYDSFTNNTSDEITANIAFGGNPGSDNNTTILGSGDGYIVTGQGATSGQSVDPVILHIYGNKTDAMTTHFVAGNQHPYILYPLTVAAGQTVSILNFDLLYGSTGRGADSDGSIYAADAAAALAEGELFINSPVLDGLTLEQIATIINWNINTDGQLAAAGAASNLSFGVQDAFDTMLRRKALLHHGSETANGYMFGGPLGGHQTFADGEMSFAGNVFGLGMDTSLDGGMTGGLAIGQSQGHGALTDIYTALGDHQLTLTGYGTWQTASGVQVYASLTASKENISYGRVAGASTAEAGFGATGYGGTVEAVKDMGDLWSAYGGLTYRHLQTAAYTETGAGRANLDVAAYGVQQADVYAGLRSKVSFAKSDAGGIAGFYGIGIGRVMSGDSAVSTAYAGSDLGGDSLIENQRGTYGLFEIGMTGTLADGISLDATLAQRAGAQGSSATASLNLTAKF